MKQERLSGDREESPGFSRGEDVKAMQAGWLGAAVVVLAAVALFWWLKDEL